MTRRETGILGEKIARSFLSKNGYLVIETNYHCAEGEIDIVAMTGDTLVFVEVRTRTSDEYGSPEESIGPRKSERLRLAAERYGLEREELPESWRIDLIGIMLGRDKRVLHIDHIENAIEGT